MIEYDLAAGILSWHRLQNKDSLLVTCSRMFLLRFKTQQITWPPPPPPEKNPQNFCIYTVPNIAMIGMAQKTSIQQLTFPTNKEEEDACKFFINSNSFTVSFTMLFFYARNPKTFIRLFSYQ